MITSHFGRSFFDSAKPRTAIRSDRAPTLPDTENPDFRQLLKPIYLLNILLRQRRGLRTLGDARTDELLPFQNGIHRRQKFPVRIYLEDVRFRSVA
jgi:hypothetical protein